MMRRSGVLEGRWLAALFVCLVVGVAAPPAAAQDATPPLLRLMTWEPEGETLLAGIADLKAAFEEANPGVRLNVNYERWPMAPQRLRYWMGTHKSYAPDLTVMRDTWLSQYQEALLPLEGTIPARELQAFPPGILDRCRVGGKLLGIPWMLQTRVLYYRTDLLEAAKQKPPRTLEELLAVARALTKPGEIWGLGLPAQSGGGGIDAYLGFLYALGGQPLDDKGRLQLRTPQATKALQTWLDFQQAGVLQPEGLSWTSADLDEAFAQGKLGMVFSGPGLARYLKRTKPSLRFATTALPTSAEPFAQVSCEVLVALKSSPRPDLSRRFARFMCGLDAQRAMAFMGGVPTSTAAAAGARPDPNLPAFTANLNTIRGLPLTGGEPVGRVIEQALWSALSGRAKASDALHAALLDEEQIFRP